MTTPSEPEETTAERAEKRRRAVNVTSLVDPHFVTLASLPANQVAFKVVRQDNATAESPVPTPEAAPLAGPAPRSRRRQQRVDGLLALQFPPGFTREAVVELIAEFGLGDYELQEHQGVFRLQRAGDVPAGTEAVPIVLPNGMEVTVARAVSVDAPPAPPMLRVVSWVFSKTQFPDAATITAWLTQRGVAAEPVQWHEAPAGTQVVRHEVADDRPQITINLEPGVNARIVRDTEMDIPPGFIEVVSEKAYGQFGWGQLDFAAAAADELFTDTVDRSVLVLTNVLREILFYSQAALTTRKELVNRAVTQFADYMSSLMDALPPRVVMLNRSAVPVPRRGSGEPSTFQEKPMTTETPTPAAVAAPFPTAAPLTQEALIPLLEAAVARALQAAQTPPPAPPAEESPPAPAEESPPPAESPPPVESPPPAESPPAAETMAPVVRAIEGLGEQLTALQTRLAGLEGSTTLRSTQGDPPREKPKDVFVGLFGGRRRGTD